jgi:hypothetical protein
MGATGAAPTARGECSMGATGAGVTARGECSMGATGAGATATGATATGTATEKVKRTKAVSFAVLFFSWTERLQRLEIT